MLPLDAPWELIELLRQTDVSQLVKDVLVVGHLVALAIGIASVLRVDAAMLHRANKPFRQQDFVLLYRTHNLIGRSLVALWATGLGLFLIKTGGDPALATPKLTAKLLAVAWLSLTALGMSAIGLPVAGRTIGRPLLHVPLFPRLAMAILAAMSLAGWGTALILGAAGTTYSAEWPALRQLLLQIYSGAILGAVMVALLGNALFAAWAYRQAKVQKLKSSPDEGSDSETGVEAELRAA